MARLVSWNPCGNELRTVDCTPYNSLAGREFMSVQRVTHLSCTKALVEKKEVLSSSDLIQQKAVIMTLVFDHSKIIVYHVLNKEILKKLTIDDLPIK